jgi:hypothetical protein
MKKRLCQVKAVSYREECDQETRAIGIIYTQAGSLSSMAFGATFSSDDAN